MKPKTGFILNVIVLIGYVMMIVIGLLMQIWRSHNIAWWILYTIIFCSGLTSCTLSIIAYLREKKKRESGGYGNSGGMTG